MKKTINIVSFDVPYPPNYGGVIDVFFKIKALHKLGVCIYLHTFIKNDKKEQDYLKKYCKKVFYYNHKHFILSHFFISPFRVMRRSSSKLVKNLNQLPYPILFEGLHSMYPLTKVISQKTYLRAHNIEHTYFFGLGKSETSIFRKIVFYIEALKLKRFEKIIKQVNGVFTISPIEQDYFLKNYGKSYYIPVFYDAQEIEATGVKSNFILYHGDLRVSDNIKAALFLIEVYKNSNYKLVIASSCKQPKILSEINKYSNISFADVPNQKELDILLQQAHINVLITFQKTGIKLKLLNSLSKGNFVIANDKMIEDTGLENLCEMANTKDQILAKTALLFSRTISKDCIAARNKQLQLFNPLVNAQKIIDIIFK